MNGLTEISNQWLESSDLKTRKSLGQYMTPKFIQEILLDELFKLGVPDSAKVLDPGVGTGEFLRSFVERNKTAELHGWDKNKEILSWTKKQLDSVQKTAALTNLSSLEETRKNVNKNKFDVVIGNPPYFQFTPDSETKEYFSQVISGRTNIFALFFQVGIEVLKPGGFLAYVVPPSMNTGSYFQALRGYIFKNSSLEFLHIVRGSENSSAATDSFADANTAAQIIILKKKKEPDEETNKEFIFEKETGKTKRIIFTEHKKDLIRLYEGKKSLKELGFHPETGSIVWNQHKDSLTDNRSETLLIWSDNIKDSLDLKVKRKNPQKKQYINLKSGISPLKGPAIVVNRVVGSVGKGSLRAVFIEANQEFVAENHVNVIRETKPGSHTREEWHKLLSQLISSETGESVQKLTGNSQISSTELNYLIPLYL